MLGEIRRNLSLALRLGRFDASRVQAFADDDGTFWRSFVAVPIWALCNILNDAILSPVGDGPAGAPELTLKVLVIGLVVWMASLHLSAAFAEQFGRFDHWPRHVVSINYCGLAQALVMILAAAFAAAFGAPSEIHNFTSFVLAIWSIAFDWFATRHVLGLTGGQTTLLIALKLLLLFTLLIGLSPTPPA